MITKQLIEDLENSRKLVYDHERAIYDYVDQILDCIYKCFGFKPPRDFWFYGAEEGSIGHPNVNAEHLGFEVENYGSLTYPYDLYDGEIDYSDSIPTRFLLMPLEEIKKEIETRLLKKREKNLKEQAISKLTKAERKALGVK